MTFLLLWSLSRDRWAKTSYWRIMTNIDKTCKKAWHNWAFYWNFSFKARHKLTWFQNVRTENLFKKTGFPKLGRLQNIDLKTFRTEMFFFLPSVSVGFVQIMQTNFPWAKLFFLVVSCPLLRSRGNHPGIIWCICTSDLFPFNQSSQLNPSYDQKDYFYYEHYYQY